MRFRPLLATLAALVLAACNGGSISSPGSGTLGVSLTDAPACGYDHVYVTVAKASVNDRTDGSGNWIDVPLAAPKKIDLLSLSNGALESLGQTPLSSGSYQQLRLVLVPNDPAAATLNNSVVPTGQTAEVALKTPSAAQSGLKVSTRQPFTVAPGTLVDVVLDFDACKSIVTTGRGNPSNPNAATGYLLKPVIRAVATVVSGAIDGYVDLPNASVVSGASVAPGAMVFAEQNGQILAGAIADTNGHFLISPLEQSSAAGPYDIVIVNGGKTTDIITAVPVTAQATTTLSTSGQPIVVAPSGVGTVDGTVNPAAAATVEALQTLNGFDYVVATTNADDTTGAYDFSLPVAAPMTAPYSATLPITLAPVAAVAGQYTIRATSAAGNVASGPALVTAGGTTTVDFPGLN